MNEEKTREIAPHPDYQVNYLYYIKIKNKVIFDETVRIKESKHGDCRTCAQFTFGKYGPEATTFIISFHQSNKSFREEMCAILNHLGHNGLLVRKEPLPERKRMDWYDN